MNVEVEHVYSEGNRFVAQFADDGYNPQYLRNAADWFCNLFDADARTADPYPSTLDYDELHRIDEVAVYLEEDGERERVSLGDVADRFYDGVERRLKTADYSTALPNSKMGQDTDSGSSTTAEAHFEEWANDLSNVHATLETTLDRGTRQEKTYEYDLSPRTDFAFDDIQTAPSVIKVMDGDAMRYAIRIWEQYDTEKTFDPVDEYVTPSTVDPDRLGDDILGRLARYGKYFKANRNHHDDAFYESIGTPDYDPAMFDGDITMIPELYLETALHRIDGPYEQGVPPVTPYNIKVMDIEDDRAFVLRPWLFNTFDAGLSPNSESEKERLATFYGTCEALNLVGCFDRGNRNKAEFYDDVRDGEIHTVFIDPELWGYTDRDRWFKGADWEDFRNQLTTHGNATDAFIDGRRRGAGDTDVFDEGVKQKKRRVVENMDYDGDILEELPRTVDKELFPEEKRVDVAAPQN